MVGLLFSLPRVRGKVGMGALGQHCMNHVVNALAVLKDIIIPETQDPVPEPHQAGIPDAVLRRFGVLATVDFHDQFFAQTCEID